jgi:hypothetical protein
VIKTGYTSPLPENVADYYWQMYVPDYVSVKARMSVVCR